MTPQVTSRRAFLQGVLLSPLVLGPARALGQDPGGLAGGGAAGTLRDPSVAGRPRAPTSAKDNDEAIKQIEHRLRCTCGCNLDVFTCRTTDFTCTYSPELHREVVALYDNGRTAQEIVDAFVAKYGERVLMAPKPVNFNLVGYLLPGAAILAGGAALAWVLSRRSGGRTAGRPVSPEGSVTDAATDAGVAGPSGRPAVQPSPEELERLRRELAEVED
ncbi:MAG TPA: cytochrome c-type biogenesis protein CcmH [Gemmatimonadales bacterium]|nr:cytochrome c-type biogenesis protein CcmH [Gemmatimonadales bacterium]